LRRSSTSTSTSSKSTSSNSAQKLLQQQQLQQLQQLQQPQRQQQASQQEDLGVDGKKVVSGTGTWGYASTQLPVNGIYEKHWAGLMTQVMRVAQSDPSVVEMRLGGEACPAEELVSRLKIGSIDSLDEVSGL
jgi:hypothetical protein